VNKLILSKPIINDNRIRDLSKVGSFWARNLEIMDKKHELGKFNTNKNLAISRIDNLYDNFKTEKDWRKRLIFNDRIDVLFNPSKNE